MSSTRTNKVSFWRGKKVVIILIIILASLYWGLNSLPKLSLNAFSSGTSSAPQINLNSKGATLTKNNPVATVEINENSLSGIICFPKGARLQVTSPIGDFEAWFIKNGEFIIRQYAPDNKNTKFGKPPSHAFRLRGKKGIITIELT
ncbi:MAG: hypothetical protein Athens071426_96 [Parcubacteria group bacterium Athens0714_26]|nr:MAG: hypothetical protein Athens101426_332 [Parcubacteria group bacterium Athens1014_26]TSD03702.1 MAG: hypothetical protein Athens071426_96 [Parcubacteria group bacterium Athens0714_26]